MRRMIDSRSGGDIPVKRAMYLASALLFAAVTLGNAQEPWEANVEKAKYLVETEQTKKAVTEMEDVIKANPTEAALLYYQGFIYIQLNELAKAKASFEKGIQLNEKEGLNYAGLGHLEMIQKKPDNAKVQLEKALDVSRSKKVSVLKAVAAAYLVDAKYSVDAIPLLNKAKSAASNDPEVQILLGDAYLLQNNGGLSVSSYEHAATMKSTIALPHYKIGLVYERSKNNELSLENFQKAVNVDPKYTKAYKELGEIHYLMGSAEAAKAVKEYEMYLSLTENPEASQQEYAFILSLAKEYKKANEVFSKLVTHPDVKLVTIRFYANSLSEDQSYEKSREIFERFFAKAKPAETDAKDYADYGKVLLKLKMDSAATIPLEKSLEMNKEQPELAQLLGDTYYTKLRNYPKAIETYQKLMKLRKAPLAQDCYSIGRAYYQNGSYVEADSSFSRLIAMKPEMTVGYLWEARTKASQDTTSEAGLAKPYFEQFIEKASANPDKNKKDLVDAYRYLGYYHYLKKEYSEATTAYEKLLALMPDDTSAKEAIDVLKKSAAK
jgi:tetratricopeptide (TPR) repeat protein